MSLFEISGWSMLKYKDVGDRMYFVFNHSETYQKMHRAFLRRLAIARSTGDIVANFEQAKEKMHVEALLEVCAKNLRSVYKNHIFVQPLINLTLFIQISDRLFRMEENGVGNEIVENVVTFLQYVAEPLFILSKVNTYQKQKYHLICILCFFF